MFHWIWHLFHTDFFSTWSNVWQWLFSLIGLPAIFVAIHTRWFEERCHHCWRKGHVPAKGSHYKVCHKHAEEHGHVH